MTDLVITDHAVLRYLERICGVDIAAVRDLMRDEIGPSSRVGGMPPRWTVRAARATFIVEGGSVVTVYEPGWRMYGRRRWQAMEARS